MLFNISIGIYIINMLGPVEQGKYSFALNTVGILGVLSTLGVGTYIAKLSADGNKLKRHIKNIIFLRLLGSILFFVLSFLMYFIFDKNEQYNILLFFVVSRVIFSMNIFHDIFEGKGRLAEYAIINIISLFIVWPLRAFIAYQDLGVAYLAFTYVVEQLFIFICSICYFKFDMISGGDSVNSKLAKQLFFHTLPLAFSSVVISAFLQLDIILVGMLLSENEVGLYAAAMKIVTPFYFFGSLIASVYFPRIIKLNSGDGTEFYKLINNLFRSCIILSLIIIAFFKLIGLDVFNLLFSTDYMESFTISLILIYSLPLVYIGNLISKILITKDKLKLEFYRVLFALIFNFIFGLITIPFYGIKAAALGTLLSYMISSYLFLFIDSSLYQLRNCINRSVFLLNYKL